MTYAEIKALKAQGPEWAQRMPLATFSRMMARQSGKPEEWESGIDPSLAAQADYLLNEAIGKGSMMAATTVQNMMTDSWGEPRRPPADLRTEMGNLGATAFGETGRHVFSGIPRMAADIAPMYTPLGWLKYAATGGLMGLGAWGQTEKAAPTAIATALGAALPGIAGKSGDLAVGALKSPSDKLTAQVLREALGQMTPQELSRAGANMTQRMLAHSTQATTAGQAAARIGAGQGAMAAAMTAGEAANIALDPERSFKELIAPEYLAAQALTQGLFLPMEAMHFGAARSAARNAAIPPVRWDPQTDMRPNQYEMSQGTASRGTAPPITETFTGGTPYDPIVQRILASAEPATMPIPGGEAAVPDPYAGLGAVAPGNRLYQGGPGRSTYAQQFEPGVGGGSRLSPAMPQTGYEVPWQAPVPRGLPGTTSTGWHPRYEPIAPEPPPLAPEQQVLDYVGRQAAPLEGHARWPDVSGTETTEPAPVPLEVAPTPQESPVALAEQTGRIDDGGIGQSLVFIEDVARMRGHPAEATLAPELTSPATEPPPVQELSPEMLAELEAQTQPSFQPPPGPPLPAVEEAVGSGLRPADALASTTLPTATETMSTAAPLQAPGSLPIETVEMLGRELFGPQRAKPQLQIKVLREMLASADPVKQATAIADVASQPIRNVLRGIINMRISAGETVEQAHRRAIELGARAVIAQLNEPVAKRAAYKPSKLPGTGWLTEENMVFISERQAQAKHDPQVAEEMEMVAKYAGRYGATDKNMGVTAKTDPIYSGYRSWLTGDAEHPPRDGGLPGLEAVLGAAAHFGAKKKLLPGETAPTLSLNVEGQPGIEASAVKNIIAEGEDPLADVTVPAQMQKFSESDKRIMEANASGDDPALAEAVIERVKEAEKLSKKEVASTTSSLAARMKQMGVGGFLRPPAEIDAEIRSLEGYSDLEAQARIDELMVERAYATMDERLGNAGEFLYTTMGSIGMSQAEIDHMMPILSRLYTASKVLKGMDLARLAPGDREAYGVFLKGQHPLIALSAEPRSAKMFGYTFAHELMGHGLWDAHTKGQLDPVLSMRLDRVKSYIAGIGAEERGSVLRLLSENLPTKIAKSAELQEILRHSETTGSVDETLAHMNALASLHMAEGKSRFLFDLVRYLPKPVSDFLTTAARWASDGMRVLKMAFAKEDPMHKVLRDHERAMRDVMRADRENELDALRMQGFQKMQEPGGLMELTKDYATADDWFSTVLEGRDVEKMSSQVAQYLGGVSGVKDAVNEAKRAGIGGARGVGDFLKFLVYMFRPTHMAGVRHKELAEPSMVTMKREAAQNEYNTEFADMFEGTHTGAMVEFRKNSALVKQYESKNPVVHDVLSDVMRYANKDLDAKTTSHRLAEANDPEVMKHLSKLSPEEANNVRKLWATSEKLTEVTNGHVTRLQFNEMATDIAAGGVFQIPGFNHGLSYAPVRKVFEQLANEANAGRVHTKEEVAALLRPVMTPELPADAPAEHIARAEALAAERTSKMSDLWEVGEAMIREADTWRKDHPGWISERRMGPIKVTYVKPNGQTDVYAANSETDAKQAAAALQKQGMKEVSIRTNEGVAELTKAELTRADAAVGSMLERMKKMLVGKGIDEETIEKMVNTADFRPEMALMRAAEDMTTMKIPRKFTEGRKFLDMLEQQWLYSHAVTRSKTMRIAENDMRGFQNDARLTDHPAMRDIVQGFINYKKADTPAMRNIAKFSYFYTLALNTANYMQEMAQPMMAFPWALVNQGAGAVQAHKLVGGAYKKFGLRTWLNPQYIIKGKFDLTKLGGEHQALFEGAIKDRTLEAAGFTEFEHGSITSLFRKGKVTKGLLEESPTQRLGDAANAAGRMATKLHNRVTSLSTGVALMAAYDFYRAGTPTRAAMNPAEAAAAAKILVKQGMLTAGREGRAAGVYNSGEFRPIASMIMALQGYSLGTIGQLGGYLGRGFDKSLAKGERMDARKAAAGQLTAQFAMAGLLGMPAVGAAMRLLEKATGWDMEKWLETQTDVDEHPGAAAIAKNVALRGISHAVGGPDVSQKYGLTSVLGFNEYDGFNLQNLFGPVGSAMTRAATEGVPALASGKLGEAAEAVAPIALRKALQLWNDDWKFRSPSDDEMWIKDPTTAEKAGYILGFQPVRVNKARQVMAMGRRAREAQHAQTIKNYDKIADDVMEGDQEAAFAEMSREAKNLGDNFDLRKAADKVADRIEVKVFPKDPGKEGTRFTSKEDERVLRALGVFAPSQEQARAEVHDAVLRMFGAEGVSEKQQETYRQIDVLRKANPFLTVAAAKRMLEDQEPPDAPLKPDLGVLRSVLEKLRSGDRDILSLQNR